MKKLLEIFNEKIVIKQLTLPTGVKVVHKMNRKNYIITIEVL